MRWIKLLVIASVLVALIVPLQATAQQQTFYADVKGSVYSQAFKIQGATVTLYTYDYYTRTPFDVMATTTTNDKGEFKFSNVVFNPAKQFQYCVRAQRGGDSAIALVYALPPTANETQAYVAPINMDISAPSMFSEVTVSVWSTASQATGLVPVPQAKLILYSVDPFSGNRSQIGSGDILSDAKGQHVYFSLPYGLYVVRAEKGGQYGEQPFAAYQQLRAVDLYSNLPVPSPTPTPKPTATPGPGGGLPVPGFEAAAALIALLGAALYLRRA